MADLLGGRTDLIQDEVKRYFSLTPVEASRIVENAEKEKNDKVLTFWNQVEPKFPAISKLARRILCIPTSSAPIERLFKFTKKQAAKERPNLASSSHTNFVLMVALELFKEFLKQNLGYSPP